MAGERGHGDICLCYVFVVGRFAITLFVDAAQGHHAASHNRTSGFSLIPVPWNDLGTHRLYYSWDFGKEQDYCQLDCRVELDFLVASSAVSPAETFGITRTLSDRSISSTTTAVHGLPTSRLTSQTHI
jgi:hypothetical protein